MTSNEHCRATLIPAFSTVSGRMTPGERRFAERLQEKLEQDYLLWYNIPVGIRHLHPDFIILHPLRGIMVLEVKDWTFEQIRQINHDNFTLLMPQGEIQARNPLTQARQYLMEIVNQLQRDRQLVQHSGHFKDKLAFPYSYGVVFPNIRRAALEKVAISEPIVETLLPPHQVICQDEMAPGVDPELFQERLWNLASYHFGEPLTPSQIDRIRWNLFPEIRIDHPPMDSQPVDQPEIPDILRVMNIQQEQLARSIGDGHRVIHGVAGSGKTMILTYRCIHLAKSMQRPILVLCYNVSLAAMLRQRLHAEGVGDKVEIRNIHKWCRDLLRRYNIPPASGNELGGESYFEGMIRLVSENVNNGRIPAGQYGAVLIDEGHDFKPEWYQLVVQMVDPETESLLVLYDDAQSIYEKRSRRSFSFKRVGVKAQGRTTILKINYRNTEEILRVASGFAEDLLKPTEGRDDDLPVLISPETAGRHGPLPQLVMLPSFSQEVKHLARYVRQANELGTPWNEIGIIYRVNFMAEQIQKHFQQEMIPVEWINKGSGGQSYDPSHQSVKLVTMHSSKGLEFPVVCIPGLGFLPNSKAEPEDEARLLYVAMTRAIRELHLTGDRTSAFTRRLKKVIENYGNDESVQG